MEPVYFKDQFEFCKWLEDNHDKKSEVLVGYYKVSSKKPSMTWSQSVDQAICFGWIDGIRRSVDKDRYCIRFTPRRPNGIWSKINIKKFEELNKKGLVKKEGLDAFNRRKEDRSGVYSFEQDSAGKLDESLEIIFKSNVEAWDFYNKQSPSYRRTTVHWIMSAKQETTRVSRLKKLIQASGKMTRLF